MLRDTRRDLRAKWERGLDLQSKNQFWKYKTLSDKAMELIIDIDNIKEIKKRKWLLSTWKLMPINFQTIEKPQIPEEYNHDLAEANAEIEQGDYVTATDLKAENQEMVTVWSGNKKLTNGHLMKGVSDTLDAASVYDLHERLKAP